MPAKKTTTKAKTKTATKTITKTKTPTKAPTKTATKTTAKTTNKAKTTTKTKATKKTTTKNTATKTAVKKTTTKTTTKKTAKTSTKAATKTAAKTVTKTPTLTIGSAAPAFSVTTDNGTVSLSKLRGKNVVLYFYPKDDTPGCTTEACDFRDNLPRFTAMNATIIGVSKDDSKSHQKFKAKYNLPFTLAADTTGSVCESYGVIGTKNMYGKKFTGIIRSTFLIDAKGTVRAIWRNVSVPGHVAAVAEAVASLGTTKTTATASKKKAA